jgi:hypothetical protein
MDLVVPLRSRRARELLPALVAALLLGPPVAAAALAVAFGIGVAPLPGWTPVFVGIAAGALAPLPALHLRRRLLRRPARLVIGRDALTVEYPELLREPLVVSRSNLRVVAADETRARRFQVFAPFGDADGFLWAYGRAELPVIAAGPPNAALIFESPVPAPRVRRSPAHGVHRGERVAGVLLSAADAGAAAWALAPGRALMWEDATHVDELLDAPSGRNELALRRRVRWGWALVAIGVLAPVLAAGGALAGLTVVARSRAQGVALAMAGTAVFATRLALWLT